MNQSTRLDYSEVSTNIQNVVSQLGFVNKHLEGKKYLVGDSLTIADIYFVALFERFFTFAFSKAQREQLPNLTTYMTTLVNSAPFNSCMRPMSFGEEDFPHLEVNLAEEKRVAEEKKKQEQEEKKRQ